MSRNRGNLFCSIVLISLAAVFASCKELAKSNTKSYVGLNSDVPEGEAPSFKILQDWFKGGIANDIAASQVGGIRYNVHTELSSSTLGAMSTPARQGLIAYFLQQMTRVHDFQTSQANPERLEALFHAEAAEMYDILRVLVDPSYVPVTKDLLAQLLSNKKLRNYVDRFSVGALQKLYQRSQRSMLENLESEKASFAQSLIKANVTSKGSTEKFRQELLGHCAALTHLVVKLGGAIPQKSCQGGASLSLGGDSDVGALVNQAGGGSKKFADLYAGLYQANGPVAAAGAPPSLSIFQGKDVNAGEGSITPGTQPSVSPTISPVTPGIPVNSLTVDQLLGAGFLSSVGEQLNGGGDMSDDSGFELAAASRALPPAPKFDCVKRGYKGMQLVNCQRYYAVMPTFQQIKSKHKAMRSSSASTVSDSPFSLDSSASYVYFIVAKYYTAVQDQGTEGACTAYGFAHTAEANIKGMGGSPSVSAAEHWNQQGQQPYLEASLQAAQGKNFNGYTLKNAQPLNTVEEMKNVMRQGRAVYAGSNVSPDWDSPSGGALGCGLAADEAGHAYSLQGFDDARQVFIVKNSWGDSWGESGYYYIPYKCYVNAPYAEMYDLQFGK